MPERRDCERRAASSWAERSAPYIACFLLGVLMPGCRAVAWPDRLRLSPDGRTIAYVWREGIVGGVSLHTAVAATSSEVRWCPTTSPDRQRSVHLYRDIFIVARGGAGTVRHLAFSPDSAHLAVAAKGRLIIVRLASGRHRRHSPGGEYVTSFSWTGPQEVAYATMKEIQRGKKYIRTLWRQRIDAPGSQRVTLLRVTVPPAPAAVHWSPHGRWAIFVHPHEPGLVTLLDTRAGAVHAFGRRKGEMMRVAWKRDGSAAFCLLEDEAEQWECLLIKPATRQVADLSMAFSGTVGDNSGAEIDPLWTADGRYVLIDSGDHYLLVQPQPWKATKLKPFFGDRSALGEELCLVRTWVLPGCLVAEGPLTCYAIDYQSRELGVISRARPWAVSPDGKRIAEIAFGSSKVTVRELTPPGPRSGDTQN